MLGQFDHIRVKARRRLFIYGVCVIKGLIKGQFGQIRVKAKRRLFIYGVCVWPDNLSAPRKLLIV